MSMGHTFDLLSDNNVKSIILISILFFIIKIKILNNVIIS